MNVRSVLKLVVCLLAAIHVLPAQVESRIPREARALVVRIRAAGGGMENPETGAGVIVGATDSTIDIATARHVVAGKVSGADGPVWKAADSVKVSFSDSTSATAARVIWVDTSAMDLAVVRVQRRAVLPAQRWTVPALDRLGDARALQVRDAVLPMGCPLGHCWETATPNDYLVVEQPAAILFQSTFVNQGSSGGALFNEWWEVVGLVVTNDPPIANALPIKKVIDRLEQARIHVQLHPAPFPRAGYHLALGVTFFQPFEVTAVPDSEKGDTRFPSGRLTLSLRGRSPLAWQVSALRLAPYNTTVTALTGGVAYTLDLGRLTARPFAELGFGQVESRYDRGGYYSVAPGALPLANGRSYVPLWGSEHQGEVGFGFGAELEYFFAPHISVAATLAKWSFPTTPNGPDFPKAFAGGGFRWSR